MTLHIVGCVAERFGPSWATVYRQRYDVTLLAFLSHLDLERLERLREKRAQAEAVLMQRQTNDAFLRALDAIERRLDRGPRSEAVEAAEVADAVQRLAAFPGMPGYRPVPSTGPQNVRKPLTLRKPVS